MLDGKKSTSAALSTTIEVHKTVVILKKDPKGLINVDTFLSNRGWQVHQTTSLKETLLYVLQHQPHFIMLSVDHPHRKLLTLPKLLQQMLPACVIPFGEEASNSTFTKLANLGMEYVLYPTVTGPAIERVANRYLKEKTETNELGQVIRKLGGQNHLEQLQRLIQSSQLDDDANHHSLVKQGVLEAFETVTDPSLPAQQTLKSVTRTSCIQVESPRFAGYLIIASAKDTHLNNELVEVIQQRLCQFLKNSGEKVSDQDSLQLQLQEVAFESWATECAEFLKKSVHEGNEIAIAFFPSRQVKNSASESEHENMLTLDIEDISADTPLHFDLYIHLPVNNRFCLFTGKGGKFMQSQKDRLMKMGLKKMHLPKDQSNGYQQQQAEKFLNQSIAEFSDKKKKPSAA